MDLDPDQRIENRIGLWIVARPQGELKRSVTTTTMTMTAAAAEMGGASSDMTAALGLSFPLLLQRRLGARRGLKAHPQRGLA